MKIVITNRIAFVLLSSGISLASLSAMISVESRSNTVLVVEDKAKAVIPTEKRRQRVNKKIMEPIEDHNPISFNMPGMSPKEYGLSIYHGNKRKRSNRLRFSHNAKLKRR